MAHQVTVDSSQSGNEPNDLDSVTYEILSYRLHQICREMATTLERAGGTINTTQMKDYMTGIYDPGGRVLTAGDSLTWHVICGSYAVRHVLDRWGSNLASGDMFLVNDPYVAAIHQSDVYVIAPAFFEDRLVGWTATFVHIADVGAHSPGGNSPEAREIYHEGFRAAGLKILERGVVREDVFDSIRNMTRQPLMVGLDLKCEIAANNVGVSRLTEMIARYGWETVFAVENRLITDTERVLTRRLADLPDCNLRESAVIEAGSSWRIALLLRKVGSKLVFDFAGTDDQAPIGINLPIHATRAACFEGFVSTIGHDLVHNHGALSLIDVEAPPGSIVNPTSPAPVSLNTTAGGAVVRYLASVLVTRLMARTERWNSEVMTHNLGFRFARHAGVGFDDEYYVSTLIGLSGAGARVRGDGVNAAGIELGRPSTVHNVEWLEGNFPLLCLFRRHSVDGCGPGWHRGGAAEEYAFITHDGPADEIEIVALGMAGIRNSGQGMFGGGAGAPSVLNSYHETGIRSRLPSGVSVK